MILASVHTLLGNIKFDEAITFVDAKCVGFLSSFKATSTGLRSRFTAISQDGIDGVFRNVDSDMAELRRDIIAFAELLDSHNKDVALPRVDALISQSLLMNDSFPFVDRKAFRNKIKDAMEREEPTVLMVTGAAKSGMSYLEKFLVNLTNEIAMFDLISLEIPAILGEPDILQGELLARNVLNEMGVAVEVKEEIKGRFKFVQFISALQMKIKENGKIPIFFFHDFHHLEVDQNLFEFLNVLLDLLHKNFPKCLIIMTGLDFTRIRNWNKDWQFSANVAVYDMEPIAVADLSTCLQRIFVKYEDKIKSVANFEDITEADYIEGMVASLVGEAETIDIDALGTTMKHYLKDLKA